MPRSRLVLSTALVSIAAVAIWLRCWRLTWGIADGMWFNDELIFTRWASRFVPLEWKAFDVQDLTYPTLYADVCGLTAAALHALGVTEPPGAFRPSTFVLVRAVSAFAGVATVGLVGLVGRCVGGAAVGVLAAAFMAVAPFPVLHGHIASVDELLVAAVALALLSFCRLLRRPTMSSAVLAGLGVGFACATKYTALALVVPLGWVLLEVVFIERRLGRVVALGAAAALALLAAFMLGCPSCGLHAERMTRAMILHRYLAEHAQHAFPNNALATSLGWYARPYVYQLVASLPFVLGWPLYALALAGLGRAVVRHEPSDRVLVATIVPFFVVIAHWPSTFPRHLEPLIPALAVLAARAVVPLPARRRAFVVAVVIGVLSYTLVFTASQVVRLSTRQRNEVASWIALRVKPGQPKRVGIPTLGNFDYFQLSVPLNRARIRPTAFPFRRDRAWLDPTLDAYVLPDWQAIAIRRDYPASPAEQDLDRLESGAAGFRPDARWPPTWFLQRAFYCWLDPAFNGDLWQGDTGFTVYVRE